MVMTQSLGRDEDRYVDGTLVRIERKGCSTSFHYHTDFSLSYRFLDKFLDEEDEMVMTQSLGRDEDRCVDGTLVRIERSIGWELCDRIGDGKLVVKTVRRWSNSCGIAESGTIKHSR